jgi:hypothetical protein
MQQDSDHSSKPEDAAARRLLDEVEAEPIPPKIVELADQLETAIRTQRSKPKAGRA